MTSLFCIHAVGLEEKQTSPHRGSLIPYEGLLIPHKVRFMLIRILRCYYASALRATSTKAANAVASLTAMSAKTLRSSSTPAFFKPFMKTE